MVLGVSAWWPRPDGAQAGLWMMSCRCAHHSVMAGEECKQDLKTAALITKDLKSPHGSLFMLRLEARGYSLACNPTMRVLLDHTAVQRYSGENASRR